MKMEFKNLSRGYFEEYYFVLTNINKFIHKPSRKIKYVTKHLIPSVYFALFFAITVGFLAFFDNSLLPYLILPIFALIVILAAYFMTSRRLKKLGDSNMAANVTTSKKSITIHYPEVGDIRTEWDDVKAIIYGEHTVIIIPNLPDKNVIALPISARNKLKTALKEYKLTDLLQA